MPVTQIPPRDPLSRDPLTRDPSTPLAEQAEQRDLFEAQHWETAYRSFNPDDVPHLLIQLQDDLSRARKREALWLSVILHLFVIILLWNSEKLMMLLPHKTVDLAIRTDTDRSKDATFLELPPDAQKLTRRPDAKVISDKDRSGTAGRECAGAPGAGPAPPECTEPATDASAAGECAAGVPAAAAQQSDGSVADPSAGKQAEAGF